MRARAEMRNKLIWNVWHDDFKQITSRDELCHRIVNLHNWHVSMIEHTIRVRQKISERHKYALGP